MDKRSVYRYINRGLEAMLPLADVPQRRCFCAAGTPRIGFRSVPGRMEVLKRPQALPQFPPVFPRARRSRARSSASFTACLLDIPHRSAVSSSVRLSNRGLEAMLPLAFGLDGLWNCTVKKGARAPADKREVCREGNDTTHR